MAQNDDSVKSDHKSGCAHLSCVNCPDAPISSFDILNTYRSPGQNPSAMSAAAALILQVAADRKQRNRMSLASVSPLSHAAFKQQCSSPSDTDNATAAAAAVSLISGQRSHSPRTNSRITAALALAMAASSPPSTCASSSSSGQQQLDQCSSDFRSEGHAPQSIGMLFRPGGYESVDGGICGGGSGDSGFPQTTLHSGNIPFAPFNSNTVNSELTASACLANNMLLTPGLVSALGQTMQGSNAYHQTQSTAYLSTIGNASSPANSSVFPVANPDPVSSFGVTMSTTSPSNTDAGRFSSASRASSATLHEDGSRKREQRLLKNREAARECRRKKKEYVRCLERRVSILENQNQQLIDELQKMKALCTGDGLLLVGTTSGGGTNSIGSNNNGSSNSQLQQQPPNSPPKACTRRRPPPDGMDYVDAASVVTVGTSRLPSGGSDSPDQKPVRRVRETSGVSTASRVSPTPEQFASFPVDHHDLTLLKSTTTNPEQLRFIRSVAANMKGRCARESTAAAVVAATVLVEAERDRDLVPLLPPKVSRSSRDEALEVSGNTSTLSTSTNSDTTMDTGQYALNEWYSRDSRKSFSPIEQSTPPPSPHIPPLKRELRKLDIERHRLSSLSTVANTASESSTANAAEKREKQQQQQQQISRSTG